MGGRSEIAWRGMALLGFAMGGAALLLQLAGRAGDNAATRSAAPQTQAPVARAVPSLTGRTATMSRLLSERRAVARIRLVFGANGVLEAACSAEAADGAQAPCFGADTGAGTWSQSGARLCLASAVVDLAAEACYELTGEAPALTLAGPGLLAGTMQLR